MELGELKWDEAGLVTVVAQDRHTGEVRMVAHANEAAIDKTLETGQAHFYSRSRGASWKKGESSGNTLQVHELWVDCDGDAVIYAVDPTGPTCHTERRSCFFRYVGADRRVHEVSTEVASPTLSRLWDALQARMARTASKSYTKSLLDKGTSKIGEKVREEADELARALDAEADERVVSEAADVVYHLCVGLLSRGVALRDVQHELGRRAGTSGHAEKASRGGSTDG